MTGIVRLERVLTLAAALAAACTSVPAQAQAVWVDDGDIPPPADGHPLITVSKAGDALGAPIVLRASKKPSDGSDSKAASDDLPTALPLARSYLTSRYGMREHPILGGLRMHTGVDLAAPTGSPVVAPQSGTVTYANWRGGYGLEVSVLHAGGVETRFAHLSRLMVYPGEHVTKGQILGLVGSTGRSTGPHLHYEVRVNGRAINPLTDR